MARKKTKSYNELVVEIITEARDLISEYEHWTTDVYAMDADGEDVPEGSPQAAKWCAVGALDRITYKHQDDLVAIGHSVGNVHIALEHVLDNAAREVNLGVCSAIELNDSARYATGKIMPRKVRHKKVIEAYNKALADLKEGQGASKAL